MLSTLRIKNLALVADLTLELQPGCNAITGETGAGKSIIIGALNLVLGERADRMLIRSGEDSCLVEAIFDLGKLRQRVNAFLEENGLEPRESDQLVLKRTFTLAGTNRQFINGSPTTLQVLAKLGEWLVDMHGPHDHQSLLHPARQLAILDAFGNLQPLRDRFAELVRHRAEVEKEKVALIVDERTYAQQLDLLRHQVHEITAAQLNADEEAQLDQEYQRASNAARLHELVQTAIALLSDNETALLNQAGTLGRTLFDLQKIDSSVSALISLHEQAVSGFRELQGELSAYQDRLDLDPGRLRELEERVDLIQSLKRKYGRTIAEVIAFGEEAARKLANLEQRDQELDRLNREIAKLSAQLFEKGEELSAQRHKLIPKLRKAVMKELSDLGFKHGGFDVAITTNQPFGVSERSGNANLEPATCEPQLSSSGFDAIEFLFTPNVGEPGRPLRAIASSGEIARVMLALKTVLAAEDEVPVLVFDEIDANVGGETAQAVGEKMRQIARQRQVLCITHLAPVAAAARTHFQVTKEVKAGRTLSEITLLSQDERVEEFARMLGGRSDAARKHAEALLTRRG